MHVEDIAATTTSKEVYTAGKVDTLLAEYGKKTDVDTNKDDIAALKTTTTDQGQKITANTTQIANNTTAIANKIDTVTAIANKIDTVTANATYATKDTLNDLKDTVNGKADEDAVTTALDSKADTDLSNLTAAGITKIKDTMSADIDLKADKNTVTALEGRVGGVEGKVTTLTGTGGDASNGLVKDVTILKTTGGDASSGLVKDVATLETTVGDASSGLVKDVATLKTTVGDVSSGLVKDVADLNTKNTQISYDAAKGTTVNGVDFKAAEVDANGKGLTGVSTLHTTGAATIGGALTAAGVDAGTGDIKGGSLSVTGALKGNGVDAGAGEIKTTGVVNAGTLSTTGDAKVGGALGVTGATTLEDALTAKGEATFKAKVTMENDLEVKGELKTDKISMKNTDTDADGWKHDSATTITADGITHIGEMEKSGVIKKSQFTHTEEGSETYAKKGDTTDWTETRSDVKADGVKTEVKDSEKIVPIRARPQMASRAMRLTRTATRPIRKSLRQRIASRFRTRMGRIRIIRSIPRIRP